MTRFEHKCWVLLAVMVALSGCGRGLSQSESVPASSQQAIQEDFESVIPVPQVIQDLRAASEASAASKAAAAASEAAELEKTLVTIAVPFPIDLDGLQQLSDGYSAEKRAEHPFYTDIIQRSDGGADIRCTPEQLENFKQFCYRVALCKDWNGAYLADFLVNTSYGEIDGNGIPWAVTVSVDTGKYQVQRPEDRFPAQVMDVLVAQYNPAMYLALYQLLNGVEGENFTASVTVRDAASGTVLSSYQFTKDSIELLEESSSEISAGEGQHFPAITTEEFKQQIVQYGYTLADSRPVVEIREAQQTIIAQKGSVQAAFYQFADEKSAEVALEVYWREIKEDSKDRQKPGDRTFSGNGSFGNIQSRHVCTIENDYYLFGQVEDTLLCIATKWDDSQGAEQLSEINDMVDDLGYRYHEKI
ncbi:MAG: hypothetical protein HFG20_06490 [Anaerotruncus sp.]|nr:hypothetical protein [Anaerotruncus sp.]